MLNDRSGPAANPTNWVSATLKPLPGHSVAELERILARTGPTRTEEICPGVLLFEGDEDVLNSLEPIAYVYLNLSHSFSPEYD